MKRAINPQITARAAAVLMLLTIAGGVFAQGFVSNRLVSFTDAALTAKNILANRSLFQVSFAVFLVEMACQIAATAFFYRLLSPVNRSVALAAAVIELSGAVIKTFSRVFYITPLFVLSGTTTTLSAFTTEQLQSLAMLLLRINDRGAATAVAFFGVSGLLNGWLVYRSNFLPRFLGILGIVGSVGWLRYFYPPLRFPPFTIIALLALLTAIVKIGWLLFRGVDEEKWREQTLSDPQ